jgi:hypothetical protein
VVAVLAPDPARVGAAHRAQGRLAALVRVVLPLPLPDQIVPPAEPAAGGGEDEPVRPAVSAGGGEFGQRPEGRRADEPDLPGPRTNRVVEHPEPELRPDPPGVDGVAAGGIPSGGPGDRELVEPAGGQVGPVGEAVADRVEGRGRSLDLRQGRSDVVGVAATDGAAECSDGPGREEPVAAASGSGWGQ